MTKEEILKLIAGKYNLLEVEGFESGIVCEGEVKKGDLNTKNIFVFRIGANVDDINFFAYKPVVWQNAEYENEYKRQLERLRLIFIESKSIKGKWKKNQK